MGSANISLLLPLCTPVYVENMAPFLMLPISVRIGAHQDGKGDTTAVVNPYIHRPTTVLLMSSGSSAAASKLH